MGLCFNIATAVGRLKSTSEEKLNLRPRLAFFDGSWGASRGPAASLNYVYHEARENAPNLESLRICSPTSTEQQPTDPSKIRELEAQEDRALKQLTDLLETGEPLGAIHLELIQGPRGVYFYRKAFLVRLRQFADQHQLPIIADEVLTVGRTGKFFAFEHYAPEFEPDFVVFGKGVQVSGIAQIDRGKDTMVVATTAAAAVREVTGLVASPFDLLRSSQTLKTIFEESYLEKSTDTGAYLISKLNSFRLDTVGASGLGALIGLSRELKYNIISKNGPHIIWFESHTGRYRAQPPITLDRAEIDDALLMVQQDYTKL
jgi:4-aminobutyrate aminotransferase-like enzyme